jgi:hypothetical protein
MMVLKRLIFTIVETKNLKIEIALKKTTFELLKS